MVIRVSQEHDPCHHLAACILCCVRHWTSWAAGEFRARTVKFCSTASAVSFRSQPPPRPRRPGSGHHQPGCYPQGCAVQLRYLHWQYRRNSFLNVKNAVDKRWLLRLKQGYRDASADCAPRPPQSGRESLRELYDQQLKHQDDSAGSSRVFREHAGSLAFGRTDYRLSLGAHFHREKKCEFSVSAPP